MPNKGGRQPHELIGAALAREAAPTAVDPTQLSVGDSFTFIYRRGKRAGLSRTGVLQSKEIVNGDVQLVVEEWIVKDDESTGKEVRKYWPNLTSDVVYHRQDEFLSPSAPGQSSTPEQLGSRSTAPLLQEDGPTNSGREFLAPGASSVIDPDGEPEPSRDGSQGSSLELSKAIANYGRWAPVFSDGTYCRAMIECVVDLGWHVGRKGHDNDQRFSHPNNRERLDPDTLPGGPSFFPQIVADPMQELS